MTLNKLSLELNSLKNIIRLLYKSYIRFSSKLLIFIISILYSEKSKTYLNSLAEKNTLIVGSGPLSENLTTLIKHYDNVIYLNGAYKYIQSFCLNEPQHIFTSDPWWFFAQIFNRNLSSLPVATYIIAITPSVNFPIFSMIRFILSGHSKIFVHCDCRLSSQRHFPSIFNFRSIKIPRGNSATAICDIIYEYKSSNSLPINLELVGCPFDRKSGYSNSLLLNKSLSEYASRTPFELDSKKTLTTRASTIYLEKQINLINRSWR